MNQNRAEGLGYAIFKERVSLTPLSKRGDVGKHGRRISALQQLSSHYVSKRLRCDANRSDPRALAQLAIFGPNLRRNQKTRIFLRFWANYKGNSNDVEFDLSETIDRDAQRGIASIAAQANPHFPSAAGKTSVHDGIAGEF